MSTKMSVGTGVNAAVIARTSVADALLAPEKKAACDAAGLVPRDLTGLSRYGHEAIRQDGIQQEESASRQAAVAEGLRDRDEFDAEVDALRERLPAVVYALDAQPETAVQARWLGNLTYEYFRVRTVATDEVPPAEGATETRARVPRRDRLTFARQVAPLVVALLREERAPIVEELGRRGFDRARLERLGARAEAYVSQLGGVLTARALEATKREAEAVGAQKALWSACRRLIRRAVQGDEALERLFARC